jgi:hypothetical protein
LIGNLKYQSAQEEFVKLLDILKEASEWKINLWKMVYSHWSMIKKH